MATSYPSLVLYLRFEPSDFFSGKVVMKLHNTKITNGMPVLFFLEIKRELQFFWTPIKYTLLTLYA